MRTIFTLFGILFFISHSFAQNESKATITGIVTDASTDEPVELVTVYVKGTSVATESAVSGRYSIEVPAEKNFELVFSRLGYKETVKAVDPYAHS